MYENDPGPRVAEPAEMPVAPRIALGALIAAAVVALALAFWPAPQTGTAVTDNSPRVERAPTKPPSAPTTPAKPQQ